jgi:hypothetical protein
MFGNKDERSRLERKQFVGQLSKLELYQDTLSTKQLELYQDTPSTKQLLWLKQRCVRSTG